MPMFDFSPRMQACSRGCEYLRDSEWICERKKRLLEHVLCQQIGMRGKRRERTFGRSSDVPGYIERTTHDHELTDALAH